MVELKFDKIVASVNRGRGADKRRRPCALDVASAELQACSFCQLPVNRVSLHWSNGYRYYQWWNKDLNRRFVQGHLRKDGTPILACAQCSPFAKVNQPVTNIETHPIEPFYSQLQAAIEKGAATLTYGQHQFRINNKLRLLARAGLSCASCQLHGRWWTMAQMPDGWSQAQLFISADYQPVIMTVDHIVARNRGGGDDPSNLQPMCSDCNSRKDS